MDLIQWLEEWYLSQCDGDWEHCYGLKISTLDNPGWSVKINLRETMLENKPFESLVKERTEHDWIHCRLKEGYFEGFGGPKNLVENQLSDNKEFFITRQVIESLTHKLSLSELGKYSQDWEYESADSSRVNEFVSFYESAELNQSEKFALMSLIISSFDDASCTL